MKNHKYNYESALKILKGIDKEHGDSSNKKNCNELYHLIESVTAESRSIVGIDIYKYSSFEFKKQSLIPFIFEMLYRDTTENCLKYEPWLFQYLSDKKFSSSFISTGDGGFQELRSPLHAIIFIIHFEANLRIYNSGLYYPKLMKEVGQLSLRYAITYGKILDYGDNKYGPAIINNARILSRDKLNRLLIDGDTHDWFMTNMNGIETIPLLNLKDCQKMKRFKLYKGDLEGLLINEKGCDIVHLSSSRLSDLHVKEQVIRVHNIYAQAKMEILIKEDHVPYGKVMVTVGSPNATGIE
jgi:hypothetical protein